MDALAKIMLQQGQQIHEGFFGARLDIFNHDIPCAHTEVILDFELEAGKSPTTMIESLSFLSANVKNSLPEKGVACTLRMANGAPPLLLQLWHGGLMPGGLVYRFMAVDRNYKV
jgi:hypothetical protein